MIRSMIFGLAAILLLSACSEQPDSTEKGLEATAARPLIVASNYPLYYFASEIAGDSAEVILPRIEGDPANWKPGKSDVARMQDAALVLLNGAGYEAWTDWVTLPADRLLDTSAGFSQELIPLLQNTVHQHGPEGEHSHQGVAFTIWLDPSLAARQAAAIEQSVSALVPGNAERNRERLGALERRLEALDESMREAFALLDGQPVIFSHPVYQYLEARYGLDAESVHWEPDEAPSTMDLVELGKLLRRHPARVMIWEDEPLASTAEELQRLGLQAIVFHTGSNRPESGDYFELMEANVARLLLQ